MVFIVLQAARTERRALPAAGLARSQEPQADSRPAYEGASLLWHGKSLSYRHCFASQIAAAEGRKGKKGLLKVDRTCHRATTTSYVDPQRSLAAKFAVMHNPAQAAMMRFVEPGLGNETALQSRPRTT